MIEIMWFISGLLVGLGISAACFLWWVNRMVKF